MADSPRHASSWLSHAQLRSAQVSNDMAVSPIVTFACLGPGQETWTSLRALVDLRGPIQLVSTRHTILDIGSD